MIRAQKARKLGDGGFFFGWPMYMGPRHGSSWCIREKELLVFIDGTFLEKVDMLEKPSKHAQLHGYHSAHTSMVL